MCVWCVVGSGRLTGHCAPSCLSCSLEPPRLPASLDPFGLGLVLPGLDTLPGAAALLGAHPGRDAAFLAAALCGVDVLGDPSLGDVSDYLSVLTTPRQVVGADGTVGGRGADTAGLDAHVGAVPPVPPGSAVGAVDGGDGPGSPKPAGQVVAGAPLKGRGCPLLVARCWVGVPHAPSPGQALARHPTRWLLGAQCLCRVEWERAHANPVIAVVNHSSLPPPLSL